MIYSTLSDNQTYLLRSGGLSVFIKRENICKYAKVNEPFTSTNHCDFVNF